MNLCCLIGRLTRDPEIRKTDSGMTIARYLVAVGRRTKDEADYISCVAFGKTAEFVEKYLKKGTRVGVTGRIQTGSYVNKNGAKVYTTDVIVDTHTFCESKKADNGFVKIADDISELPFN